MTWLRFALLAVDRIVGGIIFLLQYGINLQYGRNTFATDRVIFRIGVFTVPVRQLDPAEYTLNLSTKGISVKTISESSKV